MHEGLLKEIGQAQKYIKELKLPPVKADILKLTDAGPGVGCSNVEVRFRDAEMARIMRSDRVNRIHRARDDSEQNEAERSKACIGEALVDGGPLKWRYYEAFDNLTKEEIDELSLEDVKKREEEALEKNAWQVVKDVAERIQHKPGPGHDLIAIVFDTTSRSTILFQHRATEAVCFLSRIKTRKCAWICLLQKDQCVS